MGLRSVRPIRGRLVPWLIGSAQPPMNGAERRIHPAGSSGFNIVRRFWKSDAPLSFCEHQASHFIRKVDSIGGRAWRCPWRREKWHWPKSDRVDEYVQYLREREIGFNNRLVNDQKKLKRHTYRTASLPAYWPLLQPQRVGSTKRYDCTP